MYEQQTYEAILQRMLARVPNTIDKREGSIIHDALSPAAAELAQMYIELEINTRLAFASTSNGDYLELRTAELGITREPATKAKRKGIFYGNSDTPLDIPIGSRFSVEALNYITVNKISTGQYVMECETSGSEGNGPLGSMLPIDYVPGLVRAELSEVLVPGEDTETDAALLNRYRLRVQRPITSGNIYHYQKWAIEVLGVGDAKVFPLWNGPGTVKVVIIDSERQPAMPALVAAVVDHIEETRPIGANVTVVSGIGKPVNVTAIVVLAAGYSLQSVSDAFAIALTEYLKDIAFAVNYVSHARIGTLLLSTPGVLDYHDLTLNGTTTNIALADEEIPVLGSVNLGV